MAGLLTGLIGGIEVQLYSVGIRMTDNQIGGIEVQFYGLHTPARYTAFVVCLFLSLVGGSVALGLALIAFCHRVSSVQEHLWTRRANACFAYCIMDCIIL